jgi:hypothetical protein
MYDEHADVKSGLFWAIVIAGVALGYYLLFGDIFASSPFWR